MRGGGATVANDINIAFASTGYGPLWSPAVSSWLRVVGYTARQFAIQHIGKIGGAGVTDRAYTHTAENRLIKDMLDNDAFTHIFMTESDMILPHDCIVKLLALDKDIASGVYFLRSTTPEWRGQPCLYKKSFLKDIKRQDHYYHTQVTIYPQDRSFKADAAGLGCVLLKRRVFEEVLPFPWFDLKEVKEGENGASGYGSDIYFYKQAKDHGLDLWIDPTVKCDQIDYYVTTHDDYLWQLENNPQFGPAGFIIGHGGANGRA